MIKPLDILAIGDIVIDAFIKLKDARVHCTVNDEECEICMRWGDKIPFESATVVPAVGNASNAAVAAARLGLTAGLRAYVGEDGYGQECLATLLREKVDTTYMERQAGKHTNYHYVLWYEGQRTILVKHELFDYKVPTLPQPPKWLYLSSLGENSLPYHTELAQLLKRSPEIKLAFQPGTFQMKFGKEALEDIYKRTNIFFCNKEEAERILGSPAGSDIKELLRGIAGLGPKVVVITDDVRGAYCLDELGSSWKIPRYPDPRPPFEITGAGDAFASTVVAALAMGMPLHTALLWGPVNASAVIQEIGAQKGLLTRAKLEAALKNPPAPYALEKL
jgi:ribokinase